MVRRNFGSTYFGASPSVLERLPGHTLLAQTKHCFQSSWKMPLITWSLITATIQLLSCFPLTNGFAASAPFCRIASEPFVAERALRSSRNAYPLICFVNGISLEPVPTCSQYIYRRITPLHPAALIEFQPLPRHLTTPSSSPLVSDRSIFPNSAP